MVILETGSRQRLSTVETVRQIRRMEVATIWIPTQLPHGRQNVLRSLATSQGDKERDRSPVIVSFVLRLMRFDEADLPLDTVRVPGRKYRFRAVINLNQVRPLQQAFTESKIAVGPERFAPDGDPIAVLAQIPAEDAQTMCRRGKVHDEL